MKKTVFFLFCVVFLSGCVSRQDVINLDYRLSRLEKESSELKKQLNASEEDLNRRLAQLGESRQEQDLELRSQSAGVYVKVDRLQDELRILNGRLEEVQHRLKRELGATGDGQVNVGELASYNNERLDRVEKYLNLEPARKSAPDPLPAEQAKPGTPPPSIPMEQASPATPSPSSPVGTKPAESPPSNTPMSDSDMYVVAKQAFDQGKYEEARQGFAALLAKHPDSTRADNAQFWIGETYYQERWYEKAILEYQKVIEKYTKGNKVAAAMLKQGFAFLNLGDKNSARLTLKDLVSKYPSSNEAAVANKKLGEL